MKKIKKRKYIFHSMFLFITTFKKYYDVNHVVNVKRNNENSFCSFHDKRDIEVYVVSDIRFDIFQLLRLFLKKNAKEEKNTKITVLNGCGMYRQVNNVNYFDKLRYNVSEGYSSY